MKRHFEARSKSIEDENTLLSKLAHMEKEPTTTMQKSIEKFNNIVNQILSNSRLAIDNLKWFFLVVMTLDVSFNLRQTHVLDLVATQNITIELEDDLISIGK